MAMSEMDSATRLDDHLDELTWAAQRVVDSWETDELADAVNDLGQLLAEQTECSRWLVTEKTYVTASSEEEAIEMVVGNDGEGDQEVLEQTAERITE